MAGLALFCSRCSKTALSALFIYVLNPNNLYIYFKLLHVIHLSIFLFFYLFINLFILSLIFFICTFTTICFRFCTIDLLHVFYYTLVMCMLLSATSTHVKWELMLYCFTLSGTWICSFVSQSDFSLANRAPSQFEKSLSSYGNSNYKDQTIARPSCLYTGNSYTSKTSLCWNGPPSPNLPKGIFWHIIKLNPMLFLLMETHNMLQYLYYNSAML